MTNLAPYAPIECILSQRDLEHIALCHPKFGPMIARRGIRWSVDDSSLPHPFSTVSLVCRGDCNKTKAIQMISTGNIDIMDTIYTLNISQERFGVTMLLGECPKCKVIHAARSLR